MKGTHPLKILLNKIADSVVWKSCSQGAEEGGRQIWDYTEWICQGHSDRTGLSLTVDLRPGSEVRMDVLVRMKMTSSKLEQTLFN